MSRSLQSQKMAFKKQNSRRKPPQQKQVSTERLELLKIVERGVGHGDMLNALALGSVSQWRRAHLHRHRIASTGS